MSIIIILLIIIGWMCISDKINRNLRKGIVVFVDLAALITFFIVRSSVIKKITLIIVLLFASVFLAAKFNRGKDIQSPIRISDLFFSLGVLAIVCMLMT